MAVKGVCVIGAGPSGLAAAKNAVQAGQIGRASCRERV